MLFRISSPFNSALGGVQSSLVISQLVRKRLSKRLLVPAALFGNVAVLVGATVTGNFTSDTTVPLTGSSYTATGNDVNLSLSYTPTPGTDLVLVKNTGIGFISGEFTNLAHGQTVVLSHGGAAYTFVADYYGGTGNDLTLHWAKQRIVSWGANTSGRLGNGTTATQVLPVTVVESGILTGKTVVSISSRIQHGLALCSDGTVVAWGRNVKGQLGNGALLDKSAPVAVNQSGVLAGKRVVSISTGDQFSLALCSDGTVASWGYNNVGQLGIGGTTDSSVPVMVDASGALAGKTVVGISAGVSHSLALCSDGKVVAWGSNTSGQLGNGTYVSSSLPVNVTSTGALAGKSVIAVSGGTNFALALCSDGKMVSWGVNNSGQLGNNATAASNVPVAVSDIGALLDKTVTYISTGASHSLAGCADGTLVSWGLNSNGQLGNGVTTVSKIPVDITGMGALAGRTVIGATAGGLHSLALCADGTIASWGLNSSRQLAIDSTVTFTTLPEVARGGSLEEILPSSIVGGSLGGFALGGVPVNSKLASLVISAGPFSPTFGTKVTDYAKTVSSDTTSITLKPTTSNASALIKVNGVVSGSGVDSDSVSLAPGINSIPVLVTAEDGTSTQYTVKVMRSADLNAAFQSATDIPVTFPHFDATGLSATLSLGFSPATGTGLTVVDNTGLGFITGKFTNLDQGQAVDLSYLGITYHFVANYYGGTGNDLVLEWANRSIAAWGSNEWRQLGNGATGDKKVPVSVIRTGALSGKCVVAVGAAEDFGIALSGDGQVVSWNSVGGGVPVTAQLEGAAAGNRDSLILLSDGTLWMGPSGYFSQTATDPGVLSGKSVVAISKGGTHCLALCSDGTIAAWGDNDSGQLGDGTFTSTTVPVAVKDSVFYGKTVIAVSTGRDHSMALCSDGTLATWGENRSGQLGNNSTTDSNVPVVVSGRNGLFGKKVVALAQGAEEHTVVLCSDGTVATWGLSASGQLGRSVDTYKASVPGPLDATGILAGKRVISISSGSRHNIAICSDGTVVTWGDNSRGQLGNDSNVNSNVPVKVVDSGEIAGKKPLTSAAAMQSHVIMAESEGGYLTWASELDGLSDKRQSADPDGDGISNLLEYTLNGSPLASSRAILPTLSATGSNFIFSFNRLAASAGDTTQVFQYSSDLLNWTDVGISPGTSAAVAIGVAGGGIQPVTVTIPKGANKKMFGRLQVKQP
jgi:alpha-tubulin suppressor-like RCC1 family protein